MTNPMAKPPARLAPQSAKNSVWNDDRRARLADCWGKGLTAFEIAGILSDAKTPITERAVQVQATRMNLSRRYESDHALVKTQKRRCMRCTRLFASEGKHNRICDTCKESDDWNSSSPFFVIPASSSDLRKREGS